MGGVDFEDINVTGGGYCRAVPCRWTFGLAVCGLGLGVEWFGWDGWGNLKFFMIFTFKNLVW